MLASHELRDGVPTRADWEQLCERGRPLLDHQGRDLVQQLGFTIEAGPTSASVLNIADTKRAVAVFLDEGEEFEQAADRFGATSPVSYALALADRESLPWVVATRGRQIRVYSARPDVWCWPEGSSGDLHRGQPGVAAGRSRRLRAAPLLGRRACREGHVRRRARAVARLRGRPRLAASRPRVRGSRSFARHGTCESPRGDLDDEALEHVYEQALTVLFRLLFVAYAEDKDLLPYRSNGAYREHALKTRARELAERAAAGTIDFDAHATDLWDEVATLWLAVDKGNTERGVPAYNGGLFSSDPDVSEAGAALADVRLTNAEFGPTLVAMLVDEADGVPGPVDFRSLSVREFGTIYEGLLESSLSVAPSDLTLDARRNYVPAGPGDEVIVAEGDVYFHNRSGARKSTGSYFTKPFAVEHLLDHALEPALDDHLARIAALLDDGRGGEGRRRVLRLPLRRHRDGIGPFPRGRGGQDRGAALCVPRAAPDPAGRRRARASSRGCARGTRPARRGRRDRAREPPPASGRHGAASTASTSTRSPSSSRGSRSGFTRLSQGCR